MGGTTSTGGMNLMQRLVLRKFYGAAAGDPARLPWHRDKADGNLAKAVEERKGRGRALDVGCGSGTFSIWLARQGFEVTGVDLLDPAIAMARALAEREGVRYEIVQADVLSYEPAARFDFVLDSGCLHCMSDPALPLYRQRLLAWTNPGADFVLAHWGKRHALDWRPMGPRRRTPERLTRLFAPEFELLSTETEDGAAPLPIGPCVRCTSYRFRRRA